MKILHISTGFPLSYPGGITNYVRTLAQSQLEMGAEIHVLARPDGSPPPSGCVLHTYSPSTVRPFSLQNVEEDANTAQIDSLLATEEFDIVHFHMVLDLPLKFLENFSAKGKTYLVSLHDYFYLCPRIFMVAPDSTVCRQVDIAKCRSCVGKLDQVDLLRRAANRLGVRLPRISSDAVIRRSNAMRDFLSGAALLLAVSNRTASIYQEIVPYAQIKVEQIGSASASGAPVAKEPSNKLRVTALSTLNKVKGAEVLEKLMKLVSREDIEFHFYGRTFDGYERRLGSQGMIFHGPYSARDLPVIMANTDIGLVLSIWEDNGPQVAMEFVNYKIPVLGTMRGGIPDIVASTSGVLFEPDLPNEISRASAWLENVSKSELAELSNRIRPLLTPVEHAARIMQIYSDVLQPRG